MTESTPIYLLPSDLYGLYRQSVERVGAERTHDQACRTWWRYHNWPGDCDCSLPLRMEASDA